MDFFERIDPDLRDGLALYDVIGLAQHQRLEGDVIAAIRAQGNEAMGTMLATIPRDERVSREDHPIPGPGGALLIRIYRPADADGALPAVVWLHGGGMMFGNIDVDGPGCERYAIKIGCAVVSVEYRLAPEHAYPAAIEDCYSALTWCTERADELQLDASRIAIGGESAGGGLAAGTVLLARDRGGPAVGFQVLVYPMLDDRNDTPSALEFEDIPSWSHRHNDGAWRGLLGDRAGRLDVEPYAAPARATDLSGLPPALIQVGELDVLRDENIQYATRLMRAGVATELHVYPGAYHGWDVAAAEARQSIRALDERTEALRRALHPQRTLA